jgi:hypothetical protein
MTRLTGRLRRLKSRESGGLQNNVRITLCHEYGTLDRARVAGRLLQLHRKFSKEETEDQIQGMTSRRNQLMEETS